MRGHSEDLAAAVQSNHIAISRVDVLRDGKVVRQLDVHAGSATSDATAAQRTTFEVEVADPDGDLTPDDMASLMAPFGTRLQLYRGVRLQNEIITTQFSNTVASWAVTNGGVMNGTVADPSSGELKLGP